MLEDLSGEATLRVNGVDRRARCKVDPVNHAFVLVYVPTDADPDTASLVAGDMPDVVLRDVRIALPTGTLTLDQLDDAFVSHLNPAGMSIRDTELVRAFALTEKTGGIVRLRITPQQSLVTFNYAPDRTLAVEHELLYASSRGRVDRPTPIKIGSVDALAIADKVAGLSISSISPLDPFEEVLRIAWGIAQGGPVDLKMSRRPGSISVNMAHFIEASTGALCSDPGDTAEMLESIANFLIAMGPDDSNRWRRAGHFYLQGAASHLPLVIRALHLFTFMEIIDERATLDKASVAALLAIDLDSADIFVKMRNQLIHRGLGLLESFEHAERELLGYHGAAKPDFVKDAITAKGATEERVFFVLLDVASKVWTRQAVFKKPVTAYAAIAD